MAQIGVLHEIGDFGSDFGFDPLNDQDQKIYEQSMKQDNQNDNIQVINEDKKENK